jgi:hypothetical protein
MAFAASDSRWLKDAIAASPETLAFAMLESDPHARRLDRTAQCAAVRDALTDGAATACNIQARFPGCTPREIAHEFGVTIEATDDDPLVGSLWRLAEYRERPSGIVIYSNGLAPLERVVAGALALRLLGPATLQQVFIAHELFHHIETIRTEPPIARRHQPTLFRIGKWHWRTGIAALTEIAAGAFARSLLDLPCHPRILDLIVRDAISASGMAAPAVTNTATAPIS